MISKVTVTPQEIKKGLGFNGTLESIAISVVGDDTQVEYTVVLPKGELLKSLGLNAENITEIEFAGDPIESVSITAVGEVTGKVKRGRKAATP